MAGLSKNEKNAAGKLIRLALSEDRVKEDVTTEVTGVSGEASAKIIARQDGVLAGYEIAKMVYSELGKSVKVEFNVKDGEKIAKNDTVAVVRGSVKRILSGERTVLNFMGRLSGVATETNQFVELVSGTGAKVFDTRKTTPGMRLLEKYAVRTGGGQNHRLDLASMVLIKENHIARALKKGSSKSALGFLINVRKKTPKKIKIELEVADLELLDEVMGAPVDIVMLDNFTPEKVKKAREIISRVRPRPGFELEVSGGITRKNVRAFAEAGAERISLGCITHSAPCFDFSMLMEEK